MYVLIYAPCVAVRMEHVIVIVLVSHAWSALVFPIMWLDVYLLVVLGGFSYVSCAAVYVTGSFTSLYVRRWKRNDK
jgi:hypothetical protein